MSKLVVADDAPFIIEIVKQILKNTEYEVVSEASNGREALAACLKYQPEIVLMDIIMPYMSGIEATKAILQELPETKVIAFSTVDQESLVLQAMSAGCCNYLVKPFTAQDLLGALKKIS